ncbi:DUF3379 family protein [Psychrobium sp. 1_MG-2023]|uniref:DUF3379 family protein n=1 Tax=Psychrobium sp. 1_MG-2023 TaxID=3062624 RepID=UPI0026C56414|nr:DUF3379 family protein [Psychrobium sp. 1_MG-2023]MDP2561741.1 DUF3379 family protein [Psychrobium sp. 1_MG-2023]
MNREELYQTAVVDPYNQQPEFLAAIAKDQELARVVEEAQQKDQALCDFFTKEAPAPSDEFLAKLNAIAEQPRQENSKEVVKVSSSKTIKPSYFALAASLLLVLFSVKYIGVTPEHNPSLANHALSHTEHGLPFAGVRDTKPQLSYVNAKLESYGASLTNISGMVWAKECDFEGVISAHLVYRHNGERINVFMVPKGENFDSFQAQFANDKHQGEIKEFPQGYMIIVAPKQQPIEPFKQKLEQQLIWQA